jgi:hypothetical protein
MFKIKFKPRVFYNLLAYLRIVGILSGIFKMCVNIGVLELLHCLKNLLLVVECDVGKLLPSRPAEITRCHIINRKSY